MFLISFCQISSRHLSVILFRTRSDFFFVLHADLQGPPDIALPFPPSPKQSFWSRNFWRSIFLTHVWCRSSFAAKYCCWALKTPKLVLKCYNFARCCIKIHHKAVTWNRIFGVLCYIFMAGYSPSKKLSKQLYHEHFKTLLRFYTQRKAFYKFNVFYTV